MGKFKQLKATICCVLALVVTATHSPLVIAQSPLDIRAPIVELVPMAEADADAAQVFTVRAADNEYLRDVTLYHRRDGQIPYQTEPMKQIGSSVYYAATVETDPTDLRSIQYYIQARDASGNRTVDGFAFDPYSRLLNENTSIAAQQELNLNSTPNVITQDSTTTSSRIKWWHLALGVIAAGAIASSATSGSQNQSDQATLTINLTGL